MIKKLFESLDDKVFTTELKESLEVQFNEAVEIKAAIIADERIEEEIDVLSEKSELHIEFLEEKAEEFAEMKQAEMVEAVDRYLDRVVEEFVSEAKQSLTESVTSEKSEMIIEAFDSMMVATGVKVADIVEARPAPEQNDKFDEVVEENIELIKENEKLIQMGVIAELSEGLTIVEAAKFGKLSELVSFTKDSAYVEKLTAVKESVSGTKAVKLDESVKTSTSSPVWSHLV